MEANAERITEPIQDPEAKLAQTFIEDFLRGHHESLETLCNLPKPEAKRLMIQASVYASTKLAEVEKRAHLIHEIHGGQPTLE